MKNKKVAILQSNYIPWRGYFDIINQVDEFILYDEVQFTKNDWRNRNIIKNVTGTQWLTIPIATSGKLTQKINEAKIINHLWINKHCQAIKTNYSSAPYFGVYFPVIEDTYRNLENEFYLSRINYAFILKICEILEINTKITWSTSYISDGENSAKVLSLCKAAEATYYLSGPSAKSYLQLEEFDSVNIEVDFIDYSNYKTYPQLFGKFEGRVSILDLIFNVGPRAKEYLLSSRLTKMVESYAE